MGGLFHPFNSVLASYCTVTVKIFTRGLRKQKQAIRDQRSPGASGGQYRGQEAAAEDSHQGPEDGGEQARGQAGGGGRHRAGSQEPVLVGGRDGGKQRQDIGLEDGGHCYLCGGRG